MLRLISTDDYQISMPISTPISNIINTAQVKGENTNTANGQHCIKFGGNRCARLSVVKTANVSSVFVGDTFTYTIRITNLGPHTAIGVVMNDTAPNHIIFTPSGVTTTQGLVNPISTFSNIIVNVGDIAAGATIIITIPATVIL